MKLCHPTRSLLVTPGHKIAQFLNAFSFGADVNLADLEDAVPLALKGDARRNWCSLPSMHISSLVAVRINSLRSREGLKDLLGILECPLEPDIIVVPKVESSYDINLIDAVLTQAKRLSKLWAIIETAKGIANASSIAFSTERLVALSFGMADYSAEIGAKMDWDNMMYARSQIVMAAGSAGLDAIDAPTFNLGDEEKLRSDARKSKDMGFTGKVAIHPGQLPIINEIYSPSRDAIEWARKVVSKFQQSEQNVFIIDGVMIGPPFLSKARRILSTIGEL